MLIKVARLRYPANDYRGVLQYPCFVYERLKLAILTQPCIYSVALPCVPAFYGVFYACALPIVKRLGRVSDQ